MKFYKHKISITERTKLLEGTVCQSIAFTNGSSKIDRQGTVLCQLLIR